MTVFQPSLDDSCSQLPMAEHEYKHNPPKMTVLRPIPKNHFMKELSGEFEAIDFLPRVSVGFQQNDEQKIWIKTTSVKSDKISSSNSSFSSSSIRQLTNFFDISSRPIGGTLKSALNIRVKLNEAEINKITENQSQVFINCFDYNTNSWCKYNIFDPINNPAKTEDIKNLKANQFLCTRKNQIKFFGKFCFSVETPVNEYILTQVGTSHVIVNENDHFCKITIKDDVIRGFGRSVLLSTFSQKISEDQLKRAKNAINFNKNGAVCNEIVNLQFDPNSKNDDSNNQTKTIDLEYFRKDAGENNDQNINKNKILALVQKNDSAWNVVDSNLVKLSSGNCYKIAFVFGEGLENLDETGLKKLQFFGSELEYSLISSYANLFIHRHATEKNRIRCGFRENSGDEKWQLLAKTEEPIIIEELSTVKLAVSNAHILTQDASTKTLTYFQKNHSSIEFFIYRDSEQEAAGLPVIISLAVEDNITRNLKPVVNANFQIKDEQQFFKPYICDKVYEKIDCPEIYREYKLEWLKFLSPEEREANRRVNGL